MGTHVLSLHNLIFNFIGLHWMNGMNEWWSLDEVLVGLLHDKFKLVQFVGKLILKIVDQSSRHSFFGIVSADTKELLVLFEKIEVLQHLLVVFPVSWNLEQLQYSLTSEEVSRDKHKYFIVRLGYVIITVCPLWVKCYAIILKLYLCRFNVWVSFYNVIIDIRNWKCVSWFSDE